MRSIALAVLLLLAAPIASRADHASALITGTVISVLDLSADGRVVGKLARVQSRGYVFMVRCMLDPRNPPGCRLLVRGAVVSVDGWLTPSYVDAAKVRR